MELRYRREINTCNSQHSDRMGLGFFLGDAQRPDLFGHIGDDEGFQAGSICSGIPERERLSWQIPQTAFSWETI